jgi:hypothetical protein
MKAYFALYLIGFATQLAIAARLDYGARVLAHYKNPIMYWKPDEHGNYVPLYVSIILPMYK